MDPTNKILLVISLLPCIQNVPVSMFLEEFSKYLEIIIPSDGKLLVVDDFNFHLDNAKNDHSESFKELLNTFSLWQHVSFSTHSKGHILDLIITAESDDTVKRHPVFSPFQYLMQPFMQQTSNSEKGN